MYFLLVAMCSHGEVRLVVGEDVDSFYKGITDYNDAYYDKDGLTSGRVEVCVSGRYGSVCHTPWTEMDASVVCKQLGFSQYCSPWTEMDASVVCKQLGFSQYGTY